MAGNEDQKQDVTLAVLQNDVAYVKKEVGTIVGKLDILEKNYIRREEVEKMKLEADREHEKMRMEIENGRLEAAVFRAQVRTWGAAGILLLGLLQFGISKWF